MSDFQFKEFSITQERSAMKVGTDAVILGAFSEVSSKVKTVLDVGAGTGIVGLMLAQRSNAEVIDAIEIDEGAYLDCVDNFERSKWNDRLFCYHGDFLDLACQPEYGYDLIISNPPFYLNQHAASNASRTIARFADKMQPEHFFSGVISLLTESGTAQIIIPEADYMIWVIAAERVDLRLQRRVVIFPMPGKAAKRTLLQFGFQSVPFSEANLTIEESRGNYTDQYREATRVFHPKF